jgi:hypothetical protein
VKRKPLIGKGKSIQFSIAEKGVNALPPKKGWVKADGNAQRLAPCTVSVTLWATGRVAKKYVPIAPRIDYRYALILERRGQTLLYRTDFKVAPRFRNRFGLYYDDSENRVNPNRHNGFPGYELYIHNELVYSHNPTVTGEGPSALWGSGNHQPDIEGEIEL